MIRPGDGTIRIIERAEMLLPEPLSPTTPTLSPGPDLQAETLHGVDSVALQPERDLQVADFEQRRPTPSAVGLRTGRIWDGQLVGQRPLTWKSGRGRRAGRPP